MIAEAVVGCVDCCDCCGLLAELIWVLQKSERDNVERDTKTTLV